MQYETTPWWMSDLYTQSSLLPPINLEWFSGSLGPAYVQVYPNGTTAPGWGEDQFMGKYRKRAFHARRAEAIYARHEEPFALVMRSVSLVAIDIDGKNDGFDSAKQMLLPPTLAETSKSGNGYHLLYRVDDTWDVKLGFHRVRDRVGFKKGVDIRGIGCVFHYPTQQWNSRPPALLPSNLLQQFIERQSSLDQSVKSIQQTMASADPEEILMMQHSVQSRLTAPIPDGRRNNTLFAIGVEMNQAQVPGWEKQVYDRAIEVGLGDAEATKIVQNIRRYG